MRNFQRQAGSLKQCFIWESTKTRKEYVNSQLSLRHDSKERDNDGQLLILAVRYFGAEIIEQVLKDIHIDVNAPNKEGLEQYTALHLAVLSAKHDVLEALLKDSRIDINKQARNGDTPLILAAKKGDKIATKLLIQKGADLLLKDHTGAMVIHYAAGHQLINEEYQSRDCILVFLISANPELLNVQDGNGNTPIHRAILSLE